VEWRQTSDILKRYKKKICRQVCKAERSWLEKLEIVRNGRPTSGGGRVKISAAVFKIRSNFFERTPPVSLL